MTSVGLELEEGMHGANYGYNSNHCVIVFNDGGIDSKKALSLARYMREVFHNGLAVGAEVVCEDDLKLTLCGENFCCLQFAAVGQTISYKPVSYTHLDVYKRQDDDRIKIWLF